MSQEQTPTSNVWESTFQLDRRLVRGIQKAGFVDPMPIQTATIPAAREGRDVMGLAQTGTGKTAAFALPLMHRLLKEGGRGTRALILAPTRELAMQIHAQIEVLAAFTHLKAITVFGGVKMNPQIRALRAWPDIIVACPGRLLDLMGQGVAKLDRIETLVLDEADHMFDMGFIPDVRRIISAMPKKRQNLLFSATMPREVRGLATDLLDNPHVVELSHSTPPATIEHALYPVLPNRKVELLQKLLASDGFTSAIVFSRTKQRTKRLADQLSRSGMNAVALQGNMSQGQRDRAMQGFRAGRFQVLVATDIAARGIDVAQVSHVINFDIPKTPDAYTHRIGRTGRAERQGKAYTLITHEDVSIVRQLEKTLGKSIERRHLPGFEEVQIAATSGHSDGGAPRNNSRGARPPFRGNGVSRNNGPGGRPAGGRPSGSRPPFGRPGAPGQKARPHGDGRPAANGPRPGGPRPWGPRPGGGGPRPWGARPPGGGGGAGRPAWRGRKPRQAGAAPPRRDDR